jgi:uncharacterized protein (DUF433 family)
VEIFLRTGRNDKAAVPLKNVPRYTVPLVESGMNASFESVRDAMMLLPKGDKARLLSVVALEVMDSHPGIDIQEGICGGSARVIRTRIPVWLLENYRRAGSTDAQILSAYPSLTAEDLASAWHYARSHREEMNREIAANGDDS